MKEQKQLHIRSTTETAPVLERPKDGPGSGKNLTDLDFEYQAALNSAGREEKTYGVWGWMFRFMEWRENQKGNHTFRKKTYLWLMLFTGWMGGHRYYQGRRVMGLLYTVFCWTGVPFILCVTDFMEIFPRKADENGMITL